MRRLYLTFALMVLALGGLAGCERKVETPSFHATDITGAAIGHDFTLVDHNGVTRHLADFRGKAVAVFFGYTHCPDVCPTTLGDFAAAMAELGDDAKRVQVLFVTVDPERDTPAVLKGYVPAFNPTFLGLTGSPEAIRAAADGFKVVYQKSQGTAPGDYLVDHSASTFVFDPQGRIRLLVRYGAPPDEIADDLRALLD